VAVSSGITMDKGDDELEATETGNLDTEMAELTLGQRLKAMNGGEKVLSSSSDSDSDPTKSKRKKKKGDNTIIEVPTESLSRTLIQALHSSDAKLLEGCLRHSDINLIQNTVRRIPPHLAIPLLQACVDRLGRGRGGNVGRMRGSAASAQRGTVMVAWIKTVLLIHSGHLMTVGLSLLIGMQPLIPLADAQSCLATFLITQYINKEAGASRTTTLA
jgi:U3 small nucleolar RNA-associated protein 5